MNDFIKSNLKNAIDNSRDLYYRLVILVGKSGSGKTAVLKDLANDLSLEILNVNLFLSKKLLEMTPKQRSLQLPRILEEMITDQEETVILDNIEVLVDAELKQDPLRLLQKISRNKTIVVSWNGKLKGNKLFYAEPNHPEYRIYSVKDLLVINMDCIDSNNTQIKLEEVGKQ